MHLITINKYLQPRSPDPLIEPPVTSKLVSDKGPFETPNAER